MPTLVVDRCGIPVLGQCQDENRAEELIEWSKQRPAGKRWVRDFPFGLRLGFVSDGNSPRMYIHWNHQRFLRFLELVGQHERFFVTSYGICVNHVSGKTKVILLGAGKTGRVLWDTDNEFCKAHSTPNAEDEVHWLTGMIRFTEEGPLFYEQTECARELQEATAVAIIDTKRVRPRVRKPQTATEVLPKHKLSDKARAFLLQDVLTNLLLQRAEGSTAV